MPLKIVLTPDVWGVVLIHNRQLLLAWRNDVIQLAVNKELLLRYIRLMHRIGIPEPLLRQWGWWFNGNKKCIFVREKSVPSSGLSLCEFIAQEAGSTYIVTSTESESKVPEESLTKHISITGLLNLPLFQNEFHST